MRTRFLTILQTVRAGREPEPLPHFSCVRVTEAFGAEALSGGQTWRERRERLAVRELRAVIAPQSARRLLGKVPGGRCFSDDRVRPALTQWPCLTGWPASARPGDKPLPHLIIRSGIPQERGCSRNRRKGCNYRTGSRDGRVRSRTWTRSCSATRARIIPISYALSWT